MTLRLWHPYVAGSAEEQAINQLLAEYMQANPNVTVSVQELRLDQGLLKWQQDVAAHGAWADMYIAPNDGLGDWVRKGIVASLNKQLAGNLSGLSQTAVDGVTVDGKIYGVPGIVKAVALNYNKSTLPNPPRTTGALMALVKSGKKLVIHESNYELYGFFAAFGGQLLDSSGKCTADQGGFADAMQYMVDLKQAGADFETDGAKVDSLFEQGQVDMTIEGPWVLRDFAQRIGSNLAVAPLPSGPKGLATPLVDVDAFYVNPNTPNMAAAVALAQYLFSAKGLAVYADLAGDPPARTDVNMADPLVKAFADVAAAGFARPQTKEFGNWWGPFGNMVTMVIEGRQSPADGVKAACAAMNKLNNK